MRVDSFSIGRSNCINEDRLAVRNMGRHVMAAVLSDGMGGLSLGDVAADVVTKSVIEFLTENYRGHSECELLHEALEYADKELRRVSITKKSYMGAAVAVVIVVDRQLYYTWQGNVRIYARHEGDTKLLTVDHVAHVGYGRTALTRCIKGAGLREDIPYLSHQLSVGDEVFICTDGLYKVVADDLGRLPIDEIRRELGNPEDDASLILLTCI